MCGLAVCIELRLQRLLVLLSIGPVARAMGTEGYGGQAEQHASIGTSESHLVTRIVGFFM